MIDVGGEVKMTLKYVHQELDEEVCFPAGYYMPQKEVRLKYDGKEALYIVGYVAVEASCCGASNWTYALVPGYIIGWQSERNEAGLPVSEVESISDEAARSEIRKTIQEAENVYSVEFW